MKRLLAMLLVLALAFALPGCKSGEDSDAQTESTAATLPFDRADKRIGISLPDESWSSTGTALQTRLGGLGYQTFLQYAEGSAQVQADQISAMVDDLVDCIVVAAVDAITLAETADNAASCGVPIISYDRLLTDTGGVSYYLAPDYNAMGKAVGDYVISALELDTAEQDGKSYTIELFMGKPTDTSSVLFYDGILSMLQPYFANGVLRNLSSRLDFEDVCIADGTAETADSLCSGRLSNYYKETDLDICIAGTDTIAQGIISSLEYYGYDEENWPAITGRGYEDITLAEGKLMLTIHTNTQTLSRACASLVDAALAGSDPNLKGDLTTIFNNVAQVPAYLCGYDLIDTPSQDEPEDTVPTEDTSPTEDTRSQDIPEDTEIPIEPQ